MKRALLGLLLLAAVTLASRSDIASAQGRILSDTSKPKLVVQVGHHDRVLAVVFMPEGKQLLTGGTDGLVKLWDVETGKELRTFQVGHWVSDVDVDISPDGKRFLCGFDKVASLWEMGSGKEVLRFEGHTESICSTKFSSDGTLVVTGSNDGTARLWDAKTGKQIRTFDCGDHYIVAGVSRDKRWLLTGHHAGNAVIWDVASGKQIRIFANAKNVSSVAFSPDGKQALTGESGGTARLFDIVSGKELLQFHGSDETVEALAFSPDGKRIATASWDHTARLWDASTGKKIHVLEGHTDWVRAIAFSPDGLTVVTGSQDKDKSARLWDANTGKELLRFDGRASWVNQAVVSADQRWLLTGNGDGTARLWNLSDGRQATILTGHSREVVAVALSADGQRAVTGSWDGTARFWNTSTGKEIQRYTKSQRDPAIGKKKGQGGALIRPVWLAPDGKNAIIGTGLLKWDTATGKTSSWGRDGAPDVQSLALSADGKQVLVGTGGYDDPHILLGNAVTEKWERGFQQENYSVDSIAFAPNEQLAVSGHATGKISVWDLNTGKEKSRLPAHDGWVTAVTFSPNGKHFLSGGGTTLKLWDVAALKEVRSLTSHQYRVTSAVFTADGNKVVSASHDSTTRIWDSDSGKEICTIVSFRDGGWAVVSPDGRFDTNDLDEINGLHWIMPDDPFTPLAPEIFMRDYYEPRLLARILAGEKFEPIRSLASLNRVQPKVEITKIEPQPGVTDEVVISVTVTGQARTLGEGDQKKTYHSGAQDLQLFRDGQLVASFPEPEGVITLDAETGSKTVRFEHIRLPRMAGNKEVEFSAYAFNSDRVKSATARVRHALPAGLAARPRTAYVVAVGVNAFDEPRWDLRFAVPDARVLAQTLHKTLQAQKQFERVVVVPLLADARVEDGKRVITEKSATRGTIEAVLRVLGGHKADAELLKQVPAAKDLAAARPEDLVLISFSTHGHNGKDGKFHLLPSDMSQHTISTDELAHWLRDVDAGEMILIVDACHSAATVEQKGFKPGPMGSRGLGQLAYNKRMRILAASQAADVAFEDARLGHGLLTFALFGDGLQQGLADFSAKDERITMGEWLRYGVQRVPSLVDDIAAGKIHAVSSEGRNLVVPKEKRGLVFDDEVRQRHGLAQQPALFDFTRSADEVLLGQKKKEKTD